MQRFLTLALAAVSLAASVAAEDQKPQVTQSTSGSHTSINVVGNGTFADVISAVKARSMIPASRDAEVISDLKENADINPPPFLLELGRRLFATDKAEAAYYLYLGDMRTRYDAWRCRDKSAGAGYSMMLLELRPQLLPIVNELSKTPNYREKVYSDLQARGEVFTSKASPWWVCSHGMRAAMAALKNETLKSDDWLKPESEWPAIQTQARDFMTSKSKETDQSQ